MDKNKGLQDGAEGGKDADLIQLIEDFYLPRHLVEAIYEMGHIPEDSRESQVGVGFIDIADYTRLSRFLSPKENQVLLNGLYTAFQSVLERHGGFLNKIEGDSMMFQFDEVFDSRLWSLGRDERITFIARELFYTCVEMQRVCILFNQAEDEFLESGASPAAREDLAAAFAIIKLLRGNNDFSSPLFAFFQIRIRIGANVGEVTIGNFGPSGSKQWDIIGSPVINAKRMEATAPVGGLRISAEFFHILEKTGIADGYLAEFRREAERQQSVYRSITKDELYRYREVIIQEKRGAVYKTYSVQVYPCLPESLCAQAEQLIHQGDQGILEILEFIRYYRANHFIINLLEDRLTRMGVIFRKQELIELVYSKLPRAKKPDADISLFKLLGFMDRYLDFVQAVPCRDTEPVFRSHEQYMAIAREGALALFAKQKQTLIQKTWFVEVVVRLVYASIEASLREFQQKQAGTELLDGTEFPDDAVEMLSVD